MVLTGKQTFIDSFVGSMMAFLACLLIGIPSAWAGPKVVATVDSNNVGLGEVLQLTITVSSDSQMSLGDLRLPSLEAFDLLNSSVAQSAREMIINGQREMVLSQNHIYLLQANKEGVHTIPPVEVTVNGEVYRTQEIRITVGGKPSRPQPQPQQRGGGQQDEEEDPFFDEADSLFQQLLRRHGLPGGGGGTNRPQPKINPEEAFMLQLEVDKNEVYVGEQVTATWWLYTRNSIQNIDTLKYPNLRAFFKEDIEIATRLDWRQEVINGVPYRKALLVSYALFPLKEGTALIDSYKARCTVVMGSAFGLGQTYTFTKSSPEVKVTVKPIPSAGRPADYAGGVGQFSIRASVDSKNVATNQPFPLKIRFDGRGNAKSIDLPALNLPSSLEIYSQRDETKFSRDGSSFKEFEILLIPREAGKVVIPKFTMSFFNPQTGSFYSHSTEEIELNVGVGKDAGGNQNVNPVLNAAPEKRSQTLLPLAYWEPYREQPLWKRFLTWIVVFFWIGVFITWRFYVELQIGNKKRSISSRMQRRLKGVNALISKGDWRKVGAELTNVIYMVIGAIGSEEGASSVQLEKLFESLAPTLKKNFEAPLKAQLSLCETLTFAPEAAVGNLKETAQLYKLKSDVESLLVSLIKAAE